MSRGHKLKPYRAMDKRRPDSKPARIGARDHSLRDRLLSLAKTRLLAAVEWCDKREPNWALVELEEAGKLIVCAKVDM